MYYIIQEALSNAIKHSEATIVKVTINSSIESIQAFIIDDGKGFDYSAEILKENHYGLLSMSERASNVNGLLNVNSSGNGTHVRISIPWKECNNEE
jgi:signal transduction histidine kinase